MSRALQVTAYLTRSALQSVTDPFARSGIDNANYGGVVLYGEVKYVGE